MITDAPEILRAGLAAAREAHGRVAGAIGIHVEGPFIDPRRKGAHPGQFIRPMRGADAEALIAAKAGAMVVTLAPCATSNAQIAQLSEAGISACASASRIDRMNCAGCAPLRRGSMNGPST